MASDIVSTVWPEWRCVEVIGKGSYGTVYKAVRNDHNVESYSAVKVITVPSDKSEMDSLRSEGFTADSARTYLRGIVNDFVGEISLMESLKGMTNIVGVEDYKVIEHSSGDQRMIFIRMELLTPFNTFTNNRRLSENNCIKLGIDMCRALEICSAKGIIHRDIKPENIFVNEFGYFKLGDFGTARKLDNISGSLSQKGTFNYMAPEVASGVTYDGRVDTYSLGIVLYRLLNENRLPFIYNERQNSDPAERKNAVSRRLSGEALPPPCEASPAMADVILRACAFDPALRFSSPAEMRKALIAVLNGTYEYEQSGASVPLIVPDTDRTVAVRKAFRNGNVLEDSGEATFGKKKKNGKFIGIIASAIIAVIAVCVVILLISGASMDDGGSTEYSKFDREKIQSIIDDSQTLEDSGDGAGAYEIVAAGLATYPDSKELSEREEELREKLGIIPGEDGEGIGGEVDPSELETPLKGTVGEWFAMADTEITAGTIRMKVGEDGIGTYMSGSEVKRITVSDTEFTMDGVKYDMKLKRYDNRSVFLRLLPRDTEKDEMLFVKVTACSDKELVGEWEYEYDGGFMNMVFNKDGTGMVNYYVSGEDLNAAFAWAIQEKGEISMVLCDGTMLYDTAEYSIEDGKMEFSSDGDSFVFEKVH